ncbi:MAG: peptide ABC transporter substrate-binding protein [Dictyoglomus sp. NZ13-RE01]|nr:MAG: peptide ABC transporter substrate-binding protein [Dictyoglomus sp. NZ13-RE01]
MKKVGWLILVILLALFSLSQVGYTQLAPEIPRSETLIVDILSGRAVVPDNFNTWAATWRSPDRGIQQLMLEPLWMVDPATGKVINALAEEKPIYNKDFTKMIIKLRKGCYWSDGVEFTADDVVFGIQLTMKNPDMGYNPQFVTYVNRVYKTDKYTVVFDLKKPNARFHAYFLDRWGAWRPLPKHIFEKVKDPVSFEFNPPVASGPYILKSYDPGGYWTLWERREDWQRTPTGKLFGMPQPKYVLYIYYGPPEKKVLAIGNHQLDVADLNMEALRSAFAANKYVRGYRKEYPWVVNNDPCITGITFNTVKFPYNNKDVRWALALAIDIADYIGVAFDGAATMGVLHIPSTPAYLKWYYKPLESWLRSFTIEVEGNPFKPYDPDAALRLAEYARKRGYKVPTEPSEIKEIFGYGWWKYAPDVAEKLLMKHGFKRDKDGKWLLPDGKPWKMTIVSHISPAHPMFRNAVAAAQQWRRFGIEVEIVNLENAGVIVDRGEYEVCTAGTWPATEPWGGHPDLYRTLSSFHSQYMRPLGETNPGHDSRWSSPELDKIIEAMEKVAWDSVENKNLGFEGLKILVREMPTIPTFTYPGVISLDEYYWTNYPTAENSYQIVYHHWPNFKYVLPYLKSTGRK